MMTAACWRENSRLSSLMRQSTQDKGSTKLKVQTTGNDENLHLFREARFEKDNGKLFAAQLQKHGMAAAIGVFP
jgi:hypothetical protein